MGRRSGALGRPQVTGRRVGRWSFAVGAASALMAGSGEAARCGGCGEGPHAPSPRT